MILFDINRRNSMQSMATPQSSRTAASTPTRTVTEPFIEAQDGTRLYWTQWGAGRPILFLNSAGVSTQMWDYQMVEFADQGYRCIAFDRRGHGRSDRPLGGYDYDTFADDVASVISALDLRDLTLVGHSMAGGEIVRYLTRHGSARVARIVLLAPTTPYLMKTADNPNGVPDPRSKPCALPGAGISRNGLPITLRRSSSLKPRRR
jgi:pimeloyl-ACP methyl ester carboxylesterase